MSDIDLGGLMGLVIVGGFAQKMISNGQRRPSSQRRQYQPSRGSNRKPVIRRNNLSRNPFGGTSPW